MRGRAQEGLGGSQTDAVVLVCQGSLGRGRTADAGHQVPRQGTRCRILSVHRLRGDEIGAGGIGCLSALAQEPQDQGLISIVMLRSAVGELGKALGKGVRLPGQGDLDSPADGLQPEHSHQDRDHLLAPVICRGQCSKAIPTKAHNMLH